MNEEKIFWKRTCWKAFVALSPSYSYRTDHQYALQHCRPYVSAIFLKQGPWLLQE